MKMMMMMMVVVAVVVVVLVVMVVVVIMVVVLVDCGRVVDAESSAHALLAPWVKVIPNPDLTLTLTICSRATCSL